MNQSRVVNQSPSKSGYQIVARMTGQVLIGILTLAVASKIQFNLPGNPVPITGQTFAVGLMGIVLGARVGVAALLAYLAAGLLGAPFFAVATGWATAGYLIGMVLSVLWTGTWADRGIATQSFWRAWLVTGLGDVWTLGVGWAWLSVTLGGEQAWILGVMPFIGGSLLKSALAAKLGLKLRGRI